LADGKPIQTEETMSARKLRIDDWDQLAREAEFCPRRLAGICGMSLRTLQRLCEQHFEKTPSELIRELRCRRALELVSQGYSNKEVAVMLKFASPTHFCHEFKKVYSRSPKAQASHLPRRELVSFMSNGLSL
jgi:AraC-like DNA-binding protein